MAFFKFRSSGPKAGEGRNANLSTAPAESVDAMRRRARHRLLGAAILVLLGVIGFPLLFDTQPRPVAVDIPIEIPDRNKVAPLAITPPAQSNAPGASGRVAQSPATPSPTGNGAIVNSGGVITESQDGTEFPSDRPVTTTQPDTRVAPAPRPETRAAVKPEVKPKPDSKPEPAKIAAAKSPTAGDGARARALLDGKVASATPAAAPAVPAANAANAAAITGDAGRFVIQVGAFADDAKAREVRQKLEKAGLKTYTNVAKTAEGDRTRVRVGPFASRAEADRAAGKVKGLSLPASVLSL
ncbi:SPOR domain-containing protein [Variovorax sp. RHLX14]|uniref:SPOR domain-containing protein n=1 Tax=Variovorax sp. RHLX14 TaxID=1259731 RepID=UPI003F44D5ED